MLFPKKGIVHPKKSIFPDAWANTRERAAFTVPTGETCMRCLPSGEEDGTCLLWESYRRAGAHPQDPLSARAVLPIDLLPFVYVLVRLDSTTFYLRPFSILLSLQPPFSLPYAVCSSSSLVSADHTHTHTHIPFETNRRAAIPLMGSNNVQCASQNSHAWKRDPGFHDGERYFVADDPPFIWWLESPFMDCHCIHTLFACYEIFILTIYLF